MNGDVLQHEVAQRFGALDRDVQVEVVGAGHVDRVQHAGDADQVVVQRVDVFGAMAAEPHLDHGLDREPERGEVELYAGRR